MDVPNRPTDAPPTPEPATADDLRHAGLTPGDYDAEIPPQTAHDAPAPHGEDRPESGAGDDPSPSA
ncbi:MAG: hypothetical protein M3Q10_13720 [Chloroflexota bacterium]|nr:hypothetical protein [Chloroflexota bacterium]